MRHQVETRFDAFIKTTFKNKPEIARALLKHERRELVINNLCSQVSMAELGNVKMTREKLETMVDGVAGMFCDNAIRHWTERAVSDVEKKRRETEADYLKTAAEEIKELTDDGVIKEIST